MMTSVEHCSGKIIVNGKEIIIDQPYRSLKVIDDKIFVDGREIVDGDAKSVNSTGPVSISGRVGKASTTNGPITFGVMLLVILMAILI